MIKYYVMKMKESVACGRFFETVAIRKSYFDAMEDAEVLKDAGQTVQIVEVVDGNVVISYMV